MLYLLHFSRALAGRARHYLGYCADGELSARLERHRAGNGARIMAAVEAAHIKWRVARTWDTGTRTDERALKNKKHAARFCPICQKQAAARRAFKQARKERQAV